MSKAKTLNPETERRMAAMETMALQEVREALSQCMEDTAAGRLTPHEGNSLSGAAERRIKALRKATD